MLIAKRITSFIYSHVTNVVHSMLVKPSTELWTESTVTSAILGTNERPL